MWVGLVSFNNYTQNRLSSKPIKNVSFGELDGDFYEYRPRMTRAQYEARKSSINEKYDNQRSEYLGNADDLGFGDSVVRQNLQRIEQMRSRELSNLEYDYN